MLASIMATLRNLCCCRFGQEDDDQERLLENHEQDWNNTSRVAHNGHATFPGSGNSRQSTTEHLQNQMRSRDEEEEDLVNKILDRTQQSIIDVSNLDNNPTLDVDVIQRARLYSEAVKRHDALLEKKMRSPHNGHGSTEQLHATKVALIGDVGPRISELFARTSSDRPSADDLALIDRAADQFLDAFRIGPQVDCKEELIAHMSLED